MTTYVPFSRHGGAHLEHGTDGTNGTYGSDRPVRRWKKTGQFSRGCHIFRAHLRLAFPVMLPP